MSQGPQSFRFTEVRRAILAVEAAGLKVGKVILGKGGTIEITPADGPRVKTLVKPRRKQTARARAALAEKRAARSSSPERAAARA